VPSAKYAPVTREARQVVLDPHLALRRAEAAGDPVELRVALDPRVVRGEVPARAREVLHGDVLDLGRVLDDDLDGRVRVGRELGRRGRVLLDQREAALGLGDHEQAPEERPALDRVRDADVQRLLEHDAAGDVHEQAVLPQRGVVGCELLVPADERIEELVVLGQRLEADAFGRALDLDASLADVRDSGDVHVDQGRRRGDLGGAVRGPRVRVEAREVREAPVLVLRRRERKLPVALGELSSRHDAPSRRSAGGGSGRFRPGP
jgi:hypothetical protein